MTEPTPDPFPHELVYQSVPEHRNAPMLVKLAGIFALVSAGLSFIGALYMAGMCIFMGYMAAHVAPGAGPPPPPFPIAIFYVVYGAFGVAAIAVGVVKIIGGLKLLRGGKNTWGWALAAAIVGCVELMWCSLGCVLPLAAGIFTIIILCQEHVRAYLRARPDR
jgi:hypothetical protein